MMNSDIRFLRGIREAVTGPRRTTARVLLGFTSLQDFHSCRAGRAVRRVPLEISAGARIVSENRRGDGKFDLDIDGG